MIKDSKKDDLNGSIDILGRFFKLNKNILNEYRTFLIKKSEKLASATYVLTAFIDLKDPIREKLRSSALSLISKSSEETSIAKAVFVSRCGEMVALFETAKSAGLVSSMNATLICNEYTALAVFVSNHADKISEGSQYMQNGMLGLPVGSKGHIMDENVRNDMSIKHERLKYKGHENRKETIMNILNKKNNVSIKDISSEISHVSEKTIQRDLLSLVEEGRLKKEGERRWSTYRKVDSDTTHNV